ncbi:MAG: hypothetical protein MJ240_05075 [Kiritimatiellae bacterium]|nr:hypothetical protein [Kiritimatiellia bacterium]
MKKLIIAALAALMLAPMMGMAQDADAAKPKKVQLKAQGYTDVEKAKVEAMKNEVPILTLVILDGDEKSALLKKYLLSNKLFKAFAAQNCTLLVLKGKKAAKGGGVDMAAFKKVREFIEANVMDEAAKDEKPDNLRFYPSAFMMSSDASKKLVHLPKYNPELGFGAWAMDVTAKLDQAGVKPVVSPALKKAMEDPQPDIKAKPAKKK